MALLPAGDPSIARAVELGLGAVPAGNAPLLTSGRSLVQLSPSEVVLSAIKPADRIDGLVLRVLNPTDDPVVAEIVLGFPIEAARPVRLDEEPVGPGDLVHDGSRLRLTVEPRRLRTILLT
jgi:alpha-mannosidase